MLLFKLAPLGLALYHGLMFTGLAVQARVRLGYLFFCLAYLSTLPAAARGDFGPFIAVHMRAMGA